MITTGVQKALIELRRILRQPNTKYGGKISKSLQKDKTNIKGIKIDKETKKLITDYVHNYNEKDDTVSCAISLENIPFDQSIIATCCWNAINKSDFNIIYNSKKCCPLCRGKLLKHYIHIRIDTNDNYHSKNLPITDNSILYYNVLGIRRKQSLSFHIKSLLLSKFKPLLPLSYICSYKQNGAQIPLTEKINNLNIYNGSTIYVYIKNKV